MDLVSPILNIASRLWDCTAKRAVYIRELPENLNSIRTAMEDLKNVYEDVKENVDREEKKRTHAVDGWIQSVEAMEKEVNDLLAKGDEEIQKKCLGACCPKNCRASYKIGKMVREKMDDVAELQSKANFSVVAEPLPSPPVIKRPLDKTVGLDSLFDNVWMQLQDDKVRSVGLYGMGGVGKTTLLNRINNEFLKSRVGFDAVIWVTVSRPENLEKVQQVLFNKLEIPSNNWEGRSEDERKEAIFNVLKMKKIVVLLDDIWEPLDLFAVGIPPVNDGNKSKVVFTTRFSTVCRDMGAKGIEVKCLAWEEAFALFQAYVGEDTIYSHPHIPKLAEIAAKECDGLPLALITIGRAMAGTKTPEEWEKKIKMLKNYPAKFPGDIKEARSGGEEVIASLNHACLLGITVIDNIWTQARCVKMHDVIRDMALWLASQNGNKKQNKFVVVDKGELVNAQEVEKWKGTQRLSLVSASFEELMEPPSFSNLQTLLLFSVMDSDEATHGDCRALLDELEGLKCMGEVSISLDSVLAIQTLLDSHKLQRNCSNLEDVTFNLEKEAHSTFPRHQYLYHLAHVIHVVRCPNLRKLPFDSNIGISKNLEEIEGEGEWWDELEWEDQTIMHNLGPYFKPL
ncbi:putative disease resistance protein [Vitis vinifera]|uniref:Putative disease resistance protein n=1 Tax=Vitis vinifera TaxID=29760 RepID=A0A438CND0_VITVI|nr:putative disease resistance protein [Vitis vinifera]